MCGRFAIDLEREQLETFFGCSYRSGELRHFNLAPSSEVTAIVHSPKRGAPEAHAFIWGLKPSWHGAGSKLLFNARLESAARKPSFRESFLFRRCILPASAFYEWKKPGHEPHVIKPASGIFAFAGIWSATRSSGSAAQLRCAILTTRANPPISAVHERTPAVIGEAARDSWLDPSNSDARILASLARAPGEDEVTCERASPEVGNPSNNDRSLMNPAAGQMPPTTSSGY